MNQLIVDILEFLCSLLYLFFQFFAGFFQVFSGPPEILKKLCIHEGDRSHICKRCQDLDLLGGKASLFLRINVQDPYDLPVGHHRNPEK